MIDVAILDEPLSLDHCYRTVENPSCGGLCFFVGTIRDFNLGESVSRLEFEAYDAMALREMRRIATAAREEFDLHGVSLHHRKGQLDIGDVAVIVAVSSVHRAPAFAGCAWIIDELKRTVPIWKREFRTDGTHWLNARP